uniref:LRAT domain-containing protein n=1 Tax=Anolis carolinensis TaxID=28377 RepID=H9GR04_ANOCA
MGGTSRYSTFCSSFSRSLNLFVASHCSDELKPGDLIEIFRSSCQHWAMYIGNRKVVHLATDCEHLGDGNPNTLAILSDRAYVRKDWLEDVVRKDRYRVNNKHDETHPPLPLAKILWQSEELVGKEMPYSLTSQNSEHFVMKLRYGPEMNEQVNSKLGYLMVNLTQVGLNS